MTREEARQWIPLLQAYADGAEIEAKSVGENFENMTFDYTYCDGENYSVMKPDEFRIKPQDHSKCVNYIEKHKEYPNLHCKCMYKCDEETINDFCKHFREKSE